MFNFARCLAAAAVVVFALNVVAVSVIFISIVPHAPLLPPLSTEILLWLARGGWLAIRVVTAGSCS